MDYREAFNKLIDNNGLEILENNFLVRSFLCDYIGNSQKDLRLMNAYCSLNKRDLIYKQISHLTLKDSKEIIKLQISKSPKEYSIEEYIRSVEPLLLLYFPTEYVLFDGKKTTKKSGVAKVVKQPKPPVKVETQKTPAVVANKVVAKKATKPKKVSKDFDNISLDLKCKRVRVVYGDSNTIRVFNIDDVDITNNVQISAKKDTIEVVLKGKRKFYEIALPYKRYAKTKIKFSGKLVDITGDDLSRFETKELDIQSEKGAVIVNAIIDKINVKQNNGDFYMFGKSKSLKVSSNISNIDCVLDAAIQKECKVSTNSGDIKLSFSGCKIRPKINYIFKKLTNVEGAYQIGGRTIKLLLDTKSGRIIVR